MEHDSVLAYTIVLSLGVVSCILGGREARPAARWSLTRLDT